MKDYKKNKISIVEIIVIALIIVAILISFTFAFSVIAGICVAIAFGAIYFSLRPS